VPSCRSCASSTGGTSSPFPRRRAWSPPRRFIAGADAIATAEQKLAVLKAQIDAHRDLSTSLAFP